MRDSFKGGRPERVHADDEPRYGEFRMNPQPIAWVASAKVTVMAGAAPAAVKLEFRRWDGGGKAP